jgi:ERCC4-type nuclease
MSDQREWWEEEPPHELHGLPKHVIAKLLNANIRTVQQVRDTGPQRLSEIEGMGPAAIDKVKVWLREHYTQQQAH